MRLCLRAATETREEVMEAEAGEQIGGGGGGGQALQRRVDLYMNDVAHKVGEEPVSR
jgi:hypothetical protein